MSKFKKGDLVLVPNGSGQGIVEKIETVNTASVRTTSGTKTFFMSDLSFLGRARKTSMKICEAAMEICVQLQCPHARAHLGEAWDCGHERHACQRSGRTGVTKKVRCKAVV